MHLELIAERGYLSTFIPKVRNPSAATL